MNLTIDLKNYTREDSIFGRRAARAIIRSGNKYLLIFSKYGDYKFPGGGMEKGEEIHETLVREVQEETGYHVILDSIKEFGKVMERRKGQTEDIMEMESYYLICDVESRISERNLDEYEVEYDYKITWMTLPEAIEKNKQVKDLDKCPWVIRDTNVMEFLIDEQDARV